MANPGSGDISDHASNYYFAISRWLEDWDVCLIPIDIDNCSVKFRL
jgi:hypothetical protein